ncbi:MAG: N-acetylmuramoyl-L-alanine amidase [Clostridia bacterium]|nr:N-acetylmuramoyl-L-alanine amidase [Clostridia bacterium]
MFLVVDKRKLLIGIGIVLLVCIFGATAVALYCAVPRKEYVVVIDAGHGGGDAGVVGSKSGVSEAEINLLVAFTLKKQLEERGVRVVMTREKKSVLEDGIGSKSDDFEKRKSIINDNSPDLVISIHQNKFPDSTRRGAQVFYNVSSEQGKSLATAVQTSLNNLNQEKVGRSFSALKGDYYILNCSPYPSCIVECGFLSNPNDEELLLNAEYRENLSALIVKGTFAYLDEKSL